MRKRNNLEFILRDYLSNTNNLIKINTNLRFVESEKLIEGGRIDIFALEGKKPVAIELKVNKYSTQQVCSQLLNYINYMTTKNGKVIFIAPKVKLGIYSTLKNYYKTNKLELYEVKMTNKDYIFTKIQRKDLDDSRKIPYFNEIQQIPGNYFIKKIVHNLSKKNKLFDFTKSLLQINGNNKNYFHIAQKGIDLISENQQYISKKKMNALKNILRILE